MDNVAFIVDNWIESPTFTMNMVLIERLRINVRELREELLSESQPDLRQSRVRSLRGYIRSLNEIIDDIRDE